MNSIDGNLHHCRLPFFIYLIHIRKIAKRGDHHVQDQR